MQLDGSRCAAAVKAGGAEESEGPVHWQHPRLHCRRKGPGTSSGFLRRWKRRLVGTMPQLLVVAPSASAGDHRQSGVSPPPQICKVKPRCHGPFPPIFRRQVFPTFVPVTSSDRHLPANFSTYPINLILPLVDPGHHDVLFLEREPASNSNLPCRSSTHESPLTIITVAFVSAQLKLATVDCNSPRAHRFETSAPTTIPVPVPDLFEFLP